MSDNDTSADQQQQVHVSKHHKKSTGSKGHHHSSAGNKKRHQRDDATTTNADAQDQQQLQDSNDQDAQAMNVDNNEGKDDSAAASKHQQHPSKKSKGDSKSQTKSATVADDTPMNDAPAADDKPVDAAAAAKKLADEQKEDIKILREEIVKDKKIKVLSVKGIGEVKVTGHRKRFDKVLTEENLKNLTLIPAAGASDHQEAGWKAGYPDPENKGQLTEFEFLTPIMRVQYAILHGVGTLKKNGGDKDREFKLSLLFDVREGEGVGNDSDKLVASLDPQIASDNEFLTQRIGINPNPEGDYEYCLKRQVGKALWSTQGFALHGKDDAWLAVAKDFARENSDLCKEKKWGNEKAIASMKTTTQIEKTGLLDHLKSDPEWTEKALEVFINNLRTWYFTGDETHDEDGEVLHIRAKKKVFFLPEGHQAGAGKGAGGKKSSAKALPSKFKGKGASSTTNTGKKSGKQQQSDDNVTMLRGDDDDVDDVASKGKNKKPPASTTGFDDGDADSNANNDDEENGEGMDEDGRPKITTAAGKMDQLTDEEVDDIIKRMQELGYHYNKVSYRDNLGNPLNLGEYKDDNNYAVLRSGDYIQTTVRVWVYSLKDQTHSYGMKLYFKPPIFFIRKGEAGEYLPRSDVSAAGQVKIELRPKSHQQQQQQQQQQQARTQK